MSGDELSLPPAVDQQEADNDKGADEEMYKPITPVRTKE